MIRNKYVALVLFIILCIALWNVAQYLWASFISKEVWVFATGRDLVKPAVASACVGYVLFVMRANNRQ
jgi:ABC-type Na+ efflux pump permease subunit